LRQAEIDVLFAPAYTAPLLAPCPFVLAVHDLSFFAHPEWFHWREGMRRRLITRAAARRAARVLTLSEFSAREIERFVGIPRSRVTLAPPAAGASSLSDHFPVDVGLTRPPLVLYAGSLFTRRRIPLLIEAFARVARAHPSARLVLIGDNRTSPRIDPLALARTHGVESQLEWREYVSDDTLARYYDSARVFAYLSEYEGFGIPPLEALAKGVPTVMLDTPVAREVYGPAASLAAATVDEVSAALASLLSDENLRQTRLRHGRQLLQRFRWADTAATVRRALEEAVR
jgi:glycosyltransferase involved in cell wall biosynthesis